MDSALTLFDLARFERASPLEKQALGREVDAICRETGFLALVGHGVPEPVIERAWRQAEAFFALPIERKRTAAPPYAGYPYGWLGMESESLARSREFEAPPDLKESFNSGPAKPPAGLTDPEALAFCYAANLWPDQPGFREAWQAYYAAMENLAARLMRVFAVALSLPEEFFAPSISAPISALRALNYPALAAPPRAGQIRAGAHTDYGSLTILLPQAGSRGLEIFTPDGQWRAAPPHPRAFVVNIGDLMARWTNDRWASTLHRVVIPEEGAGERRQSFAFFHQPNWDAEIATLAATLAPGERPKYAAVRSGPYLMGKFRATTT